MTTVPTEAGVPEQSAIDNKVRQKIANVRNLPTPPIVFHQIQKVINDPNVSAGQIASILAEDPAMSVKVLKLTNSAFYGLSREIESVKQAVVIIGLEAVRNLVLSASVLDMFKQQDADQEFQETFWRHSLAVAVCGRLMARKVRSRGIIDPDGAFSAGLLHDVGKIIMCCFLPEEYAKFLAERDKDLESSTFAVEERALGYNHCQVGAILGTQWKLPTRLLQAVAYHHHPQLGDEDDPTAYLIHIADFLAKRAFAEREDSHVDNDLGEGVAEYMQVTEEQLDGYSEDLREEYLKAETFMKMAGVS
ncbi:MAG: HDOD domain-containing protein [bacterium]|nr:HDOD domain-containing protein [bacterium]